MPRSNREITYFTIDEVPAFEYQPFFDDFGPPSLAQLYYFTDMLTRMCKSEKTVLHFFTSYEPNHLANAILYITFYRMITLLCTPDEAFAPFQKCSNYIKPFRDASTLPTTFGLSIIDCLRGIYRAIKLGWFDFNSFNVNEWITLQQIPNGDMNWIIPGKLLAFASPYSINVLPGGYQVATPTDVIPVFQTMGINHVIRLCKPFYDADLFKSAGFTHSELYFLDGSVPPDSILSHFLKIAEGDDVIAIHCKAGLGRTGTLIGCYMIKNYDFTAREAIGWLRVCRPGSVIGPQQHYLLNYAAELHRPKTVHPPTSQRAPRTKLNYSPNKGFPIAHKIEIKGHCLPPNERQSPRRPKASIKKPVFEFDNIMVRATPINSFHPQPRKVNQIRVRK